MLEVGPGVGALTSALVESAAEVVPSLGLWAQVPHYVPSGPYPAAMLALVEGLANEAGIRVDTAPLAERALTNRRRLDELVAGDASHGEMLAELERRQDEASDTEIRMPTSDELAAEVEQFLRDRGDNGKDGE